MKKRQTTSNNHSGIIYSSKAIQETLELASRVATTDATVLLQGESGTGKELFAKYIHSKSNRSKSPFIAINCAALPDRLLESELFGYVKGAFTGAEKNKNGLFHETGNGTLFMDEIGEMSLDIQAKLLRAIQEKEIRPVGSSKVIPFKGRIIAATNKKLDDMVKKYKFREDLYYRLSVFPLYISSLRNRKEDIITLARYFLSNIDTHHPGFNPETIKRLESYHWPGNVRELENSIEYANILSSNQRILPTHLPEAILKNSNYNDAGIVFPEMVSLKDMEAKYIKQVLEATDNNKTHACRILNISPSTLWRHLQQRN